MASKSINTVLNMKNNMSRPLKEAAGDTRLLKSDVKKMDTVLRTWSRNADKKITRVTSSIKKLAAAGGTLAAAFAVKTGFGEAFEMEGFRVQLETATKSAEIAGKKMAWAVEYANKTPFETGSIVEATARLEAMKLNAEKWLPDIANMAGSTAKDMGQAYEAVIDATTGEFERLKEFGIRKNDLIARSDEMFGKNAVFNTQGSVVDQIKLQEVLMAEMQSRYKGGADKLSQTGKGLWSTVTGVTKSSLAKIVGMQSDGTIKQGSMLESLKEKIKTAADTLQKWQSDGTIDRIAAQTTRAFNAIYKAVSGTFNFIRKHEKLLSTVIVGFLAFRTATKAIKKTKAAVEGLKLGMTAIKTVGLTALNPWALGITAVVALVYVLWRNWDSITKFVKDTVKVIGSLFKALFVGAAGGAKEMAVSIGGFFKGLWEGIGNGLKGFLNFYISGFNKLIDAINGIKVDIPDWVPKFGGKTFGISIPTIPEFALGTNYFTGGAARINERGGEIVNLPSGAHIIPADKSQQLVNNRNSTINLTINVNNAKMTAAEVADVLAPKIKMALANI